MKLSGPSQSPKRILRFSLVEVIRAKKIPRRAARKLPFFCGGHAKFNFCDPFSIRIYPQNRPKIDTTAPNPQYDTSTATCTAQNPTNPYRFVKQPTQLMILDTRLVCASTTNSPKNRYCRIKPTIRCHHCHLPCIKPRVFARCLRQISPICYSVIRVRLATTLTYFPTTCDLEKL